MKIPIIYDRKSEDSNKQQWDACLSCTLCRAPTEIFFSRLYSKAACFMTLSSLRPYSVFSKLACF